MESLEDIDIGVVFLYAICKELKESRKLKPQPAEMCDKILKIREENPILYKKLISEWSFKQALNTVKNKLLDSFEA